MHWQCNYYIVDAFIITNSGCIDLKYTTTYQLLNSRCINAIIHLLINNRMHLLWNSTCVDNASIHLLLNSRCIDDASNNTLMNLLLHSICIDNASNNSRCIDYVSTMYLLLDASTMHLMIRRCIYYSRCIDTSTN